jgi:phage major head subunit gpT-like protein
MIINRGNLRDLQTAYRTNFQSAFDGVEPTYAQVATVVPSSTAEEKYPWLGQVPGMREWIGPRLIKNLSEHGYSIRNREWEMTVSVPRPAIEDDQYGVYSVMMTEMGRAARLHPDELVWGLLKAGFSTLCFDGQYFFDNDHPVLTPAGAEVSVSNMQAGAGEPWFLLDLSRGLKPLIFQERKKPEFVWKDDPEISDEVFMLNQYVYGAYARYNVGFGFWQMAFGSKATLNQANFRAARNAMALLKSDTNGQPLGVKATHLVVGPTNGDAARDIILSERLANGQTNTDRNLVQIIETPWLG